MPRANRYFIPGQIWHITQRCHQKEFLLKFKRDRRRWLHWLFEAKKRFGLNVLNYIVTSNHIHLLVKDGFENQVSESMQLIASRTAQEFNQRKNRHGAFWEDRFHATAVDSFTYLIQCLTYIDLNMVRAGVVGHPSEWAESGFSEIQSPPSRYQIINQKSLCDETGFSSFADLQKQQAKWIQDALSQNDLVRDAKWTESLAVGRQSFVESFCDELGFKAGNRKVESRDDCFVVREPPKPYNSDL